VPDALLGGMVVRPTRRIIDYDACGGFVKAHEQVPARRDKSAGGTALPCRENSIDMPDHRTRGRWGPTRNTNTPLWFSQAEFAGPRFALALK
jgi:hypothetical protein